MTKIDDKHHLEGETIVKTGNGITIDLTKEPVILFRGRDKLALPMLKYYIELCKADGCTDYQMDSMGKMLKRFEDFNGIKQPGCTLGK